MADAVLRHGDKEIILPAYEGTEGEIAIDIGRLRSEIGITTTDRGFANTAEGESAVTYINGEEGILRYRGYSIEQLSEKASFLEVVYLLQYGELPNKAEIDAYEARVTRHAMLREDVKHLFEAFPHTAHPMQILRKRVGATTSCRASRET